MPIDIVNWREVNLPNLLRMPAMGVGNSTYSDETFFWQAGWSGDHNLYYFYSLPLDGRMLLIRYQEMTKDEQIVAGAIFADWLEENREYLLIGARGPTDPAKRLDELIAYLRSRL